VPVQLNHKWVWIIGLSILGVSIGIGLVGWRYLTAELPQDTLQDTVIKQRLLSTYIPMETGVGQVDVAQAYLLHRYQLAIFVDARVDYAHQRLRIPSSIRLHPKEYFFLKHRLRPYDKTQLIVVYCHSIQCPLSTQLAEAMRQDGFVSVYVMHEGLKEWFKRKFPVESDYVGL